MLHAGTSTALDSDERRAEARHVGLHDLAVSVANAMPRSNCESPLETAPGPSLQQAHFTCPPAWGPS